jgi:cell surface protein SprA
VESKAYQNAFRDPSSDNYHYFRGSDYDTLKTSILCRYKKYNGQEGNSGSTELYPTSATTYPDREDVNHNGSLDTAENYFQYKVILKPENLVVGQNFITEKRLAHPVNGSSVNWYKFLIPIRTSQKETIGNIESPDSAGYLRLVLKDFTDSVVLRFAVLEFVTTDIPEPQNIPVNSDILIFPNPCTGTLNISSKDENITRIKIYDLAGRILNTIEIPLAAPFYTIDLSHFVSGCYFLEVSTATTSVIRKLIITI